MPKDPFPFKDIYHISNTLVDAATVVVTDLCENLSNSINVYSEDILDELKDKDTKKFNSISVSNSMDGMYPVWVGVDEKNKVRKIIASTNSSTYKFFKTTDKLVSWFWNKEDLNDQFFSGRKKNIKRLKLFNMKINSGAIAFADAHGHFYFRHHPALIEALNEMYFKVGDVYQNNYPIGLYLFNYGDKDEPKASSFSSSKIHDVDTLTKSKTKLLKYTEFLSPLLKENYYPTKYIFENYLIEDQGYEDNKVIKVANKKIIAEDLSKRLPRALKILEKQNKVLFGKKFKEVHKLRKNQFEKFIQGIVKDLKQDELNPPKVKKQKANTIIPANKLTVEPPDLSEPMEALYDGYKLKSEPFLKGSPIIPVKNGKYPCYIHHFKEPPDEDGYEYENVYVVLEGIEGCYLNRNAKGEIFFDKIFRESLYLKEQIKLKAKKISLDKVCLRNTDNLDELKKIDFVEELELYNFKNIKNWNGLAKLKKLKKLKFFATWVESDYCTNFLKNLYALPNLEELILDDTCRIRPYLIDKSKFPKNSYFRKLKSFKIDIRDSFKKGPPEKYPDHKGYGDEDFTPYHNIPAIFEFPNFEKFKSLEQLDIYNYFQSNFDSGTFFADVYRRQFADVKDVNYQEEESQHIKVINKLCRNSNIKKLWIHGYSVKDKKELAGTFFQDKTLELTEGTNITINGMNRSSFKKLKFSK